MLRQSRALKAIRSFGRSYGSRSRPPRPKKFDKPAPVPTQAFGSEFVYGVQPVLAVLKAKKRSVYNLFINQESSGGKDRENKLQEIESKWRNALANVQNDRSKIFYVDTGKLHNIVGKDKPHQGVVLEVSPIEPDDIDYLTKEDGQVQLPGGRKPVWVALDEVQDPQNFGAILRSCVYFGVDGIVTTEKKSSPLSAAVSKASAGGLEVAPLKIPGNLIRFLRDSKANGWRVVGTSVQPGRTINCTDLKLDAPTILVLGNEGQGVRPKVLEQCDALVKIPSLGPSMVDSLNVSAATAVLLYQVLAPTLATQKP